MTIVITAGQHPQNYINALTSHGLDAHVCLAPAALTWYEAGRISRELAAAHNALLLSGGGDIQPELYGQTQTHSRNIDINRDRLELYMLNAFLELGKPVLGICRGIQIINIYFGGTLYQHIDGHSQINDKDSLHTVEWKGRTVEINSAHHQVIDKLGNGLKAVAVSSDRFIEAVSHDILPIMAFQWHPERHEPTKDKVFSDFEYLCKNT